MTGAIPRVEDTTIKPPINNLSKPAVALPFAWLALLCLVMCAGCQTTARGSRPINSDDVDRSVSLPRTLQNVWFRPETQAQFAVPFTAEGTLLVSGEGLSFTHAGGMLSVPAHSIRSVNWRQMSGDRQTEWAVVCYMEGGTEKLVGFTAADRYRFDTSNKELFSAIVVAWESQTQPAR